MKFTPECYPCIVRQAATAVKLAGVDTETQYHALNKVLHSLASSDHQLSPSDVAGETNRIIREVTGVDDFYLQKKKASHELAMSYLDQLRSLVSQGPDPLVQALKVGAAGNIIDVVHVEEYDLWEEVTTTVQGQLLGGGLPAFKDKLNSASFILYLADNVGETVFDRVLIETLALPVIYSVKSGPILNDATREDAIAAGIDQVAEIVENGTRSPGTVLSQASAEFLELIDKAELVLSKGQANYETLDDQGEKIFFLMRVKCPLLSQAVNAPVGSLLFKQG
jgi:uncharacterized protein with ATP-grasp and redox domains